MLAAQEVTEPEEIARSARVIRDQADRMTRIVRQLLDFARHRAASVRRRTSPSSRGTRSASLKPLAAKRRVGVRCIEPEQAVVARIDPIRSSRR